MPRREMKKSDIHDVIYQVCLVGSVATLPYSRWLSSFSIIVMCINWIIEGNFKAKAFALRQNKLAMLMLAFFTCTAAGLLNTHDFSNCAFDLQKKLAFLAMGIVLGSTKVYDQFKLRRLFYFFTFI